MDERKGGRDENLRVGELRLRWGRWPGPAAVLGGSLLLLVSVTLTHSIVLYAVSSLCFLVAAVGLLERHADRMGALGRYGLTAAAVGAGLTVVVWGLYALNWGAWLYAFILTFFLGLHGGVLLFGIEARRKELLPRRNALPVVIGLSFVVPGLLLTWNALYFWSGLVWTGLLVGGVGWVLLGYASWSDTSDPGPVDPDPADPEPDPTEPADPEPDPTEPDPTEPDPTEPDPTEPDPPDELPAPLHGRVRDVETNAPVATAETTVRATDSQLTDPLGSATTASDGRFVVPDFRERVRESFPDERPALRFDVAYEGASIDVDRTPFDWDAFADGGYVHSVGVHLPDPDPDPDCDDDHRSISW
ncbi:carboxypeptidase-like regulatory domain-containing protein [Halosimplex amylolyticum]|uniref:carboxypeptidase-like regulatory domain-containing protein n=1 Tax=Halosimplex amylolyticum TaxID=3396616 RepID=UPI003F559703